MAVQRQDRSLRFVTILLAVPPSFLIIEDDGAVHLVLWEPHVANKSNSGFACVSSQEDQG